MSKPAKLKGHGYIGQCARHAVEERLCQLLNVARLVAAPAGQKPNPRAMVAAVQGDELSLLPAPAVMAEAR